ncbi:chaperone protein ClpB [Artemisia annua]|uniref:Chaperone protein ClpB n=1 Tax=Artemisia annua TaxID=35608 RepID=A0A2U1LPB0_ARTAN|nr:chaperone protein ClpB [Artemisia annua]
MLNPDTFTRLTYDTLMAAHDIAKAAGHEEFTLLHVAAASISFWNSLFKQAITNVGDEETSNRAEYVFNEALRKLPSQSITLDCVLVCNHVLVTLRWAQKLQRRTGDTYLAYDHLMLGLLQRSEIVDLLHEANVSVSRLKTEVQHFRGKDFRVQSAFGDDRMVKYRALKTYGHDLVEQASKLGPVIGRDEEIERIFRGDVPSKLADVRIVALDMGALTAGTKFTWEFLGRLGNVLEEVAKSDGKVILFIDELHIFLRAGRVEEGSKDVANLLKLMLARRELQCVGATTLEEHRKYIENDASFERPFQQVLVAEPSVTDTINILRGLQKKYEDHHKVLIHDSALVAAVQLSSQYISEGSLPNKAIDLLDEACANVRVQMNSETRKINNCERLIMQLEVRLHALQNKKDKESKALISEMTTELDGLTEKLGLLRMEYKKIKDRTHEIRSLKQKQEQLMVALDEALRQGDTKRALDLSYGELHEVDTAISKFDDTIYENSMLTETVGPDRITKVISHRTGIPLTRLGTSVEERLRGLSNRLHQRVVGQDQAVTAVSEAVLRGQVGFGRDGQPAGSVLELAKALAERLFDDEKAIIRLDVSEYTEQESVARLIGTPQG